MVTGNKLSRHFPFHLFKHFSINYSTYITFFYSYRIHYLHLNNLNTLYFLANFSSYIPGFGLSLSSVASSPEQSRQDNIIILQNMLLHSAITKSHHLCIILQMLDSGNLFLKILKKAATVHVI
jgi:hypothetical protein